MTEHRIWKSGILPLVTTKFMQQLIKGVYYADIANQGLAYFGNWSIIGSFPFPTGKYTALVFSGNKLYANLSAPFSGGDSVYSMNAAVTLFSFLAGVYNTSFDAAPGGFTISSPSLVRLFNNDGSPNRSIASFGDGSKNPNISQSVADNGNIWIADINSGLIRESMSAFSTLTLPGPSSNNAIQHHLSEWKNNYFRRGYRCFLE